ncbi:MAG TPA: DUF1043 family protein [Candidatus Krumholzibacteria bacterium]|nr:DUF1043 family protein [Candidatus Krumholzibacteria bacterium]
MDLLVTAAIALVAGIGVGILVSGRLDRPNKRTRILEADLDSTRTELASYRQSALAQFTQTAERFKDLNDAYVALHRQLAESAHRLCGTEIGRLLEEPRTEGQLAADEASTGQDADGGVGETVHRGAIPWSESVAGTAAGADAAGSASEEASAAGRGSDEATDEASRSDGALAEDSGSAPSEDTGQDASSGTEEPPRTPESGAAAAGGNGDGDAAETNEDGERPLTRTEAFRAARAERAAATASGEPRSDDARSDDGGASENRGAAA